MTRLAATALVAALLLAGAGSGAASPDPKVFLDPPSGPVGISVRVRGTGLPRGARVTVVWHTDDVRWQVVGGRFLGARATPVERVLSVATVDGQGSFHTSFRVPEDYGFVHNVTVQSADQVLVLQGFTVLPRMTIAPSSGPPGTLIAVTVTGLGYRFYESGWHLVYDGRHTGWVSAVTTHGTALLRIPATGVPGAHLLELLDGPRAPYLNIEQSPNFYPVIPYHSLDAVFTVTAGAAVLPPDPVSQRPPRLRGTRSSGTGPALSLDFASGPVGSPVRLLGIDFPPRARVRLTWSTVVGNRIDQRGWETIQRPLGDAQTDSRGRFAWAFRTPEDLGGPHQISAEAEPARASTLCTITPTVEVFRPRRVAPGGMLDLVVTGGGWTDTGNIYTLVLDNGYLGYACGFNSQGTIRIHLRAPVRPGWHFLDLYPAIYHGPAEFAASSNDHYQLPMLNPRDHPGENLPVFHLAFRVL
jgi:hypothetical protein